MKLWLAVEQNSKVLEAVVVSWSEGCWKRMIPKRDPDEKDGLRIWVVEHRSRRVFGSYSIKTLEQFHENNRWNHSEEVLYGFFGVVGIGNRWVDRKDVKWCLVLGDKELARGDKI